MLLSFHVVASFINFFFLPHMLLLISSVKEFLEFLPDTNLDSIGSESFRSQLRAEFTDLREET